MCSSNLFTYHCQYEKYLYQKRIRIIRVKCLSCDSTHALIPEFSLPGTSIGTVEAEKYQRIRNTGESQKKAAQVFIDMGMSRDYGISLEKKFKMANLKAMVLFPEKNDILHDPYKLYSFSTGFNGSVILEVNNLFLNRGYNPLYFSRNNILRIRELKTGKRLPLNKPSIWSDRLKLDSS